MSMKMKLLIAFITLCATCLFAAEIASNSNDDLGDLFVDGDDRGRYSVKKTLKYNQSDEGEDKGFIENDQGVILPDRGPYGQDSGKVFNAFDISDEQEDGGFMRNNQGVMLPDADDYKWYDGKNSGENFSNSELSNELSGNQHRRSKRTPDACKIPEDFEFKNMDMNCTYYPELISCKQKCVFGYTLSDGIQRHMRCLFDENEWTPVSEFEECQPFIDCNIALASDGKYKCTTAQLTKGPTCDIACFKFEDKKEVPKATYECDIDGKWIPELPFCAKAGIGFQHLVPPPQGPKEHAE